METYHVLTAETKGGVLQTALVSADDFAAEDSDPEVFFPALSINAEDHGTVEIDGKAVGILPPILTDNC